MCGYRAAGERSIRIDMLERLADLLRARDLSCDELSLMYCYKHGMAVTQALQMLGLGEKLQDFVGKQKALHLNNNHVSLVRQDTTLKPFSVACEVEREDIAVAKVLRTDAGFRTAAR